MTIVFIILSGCSVSVDQEFTGHLLTFDSTGGNFIEPIKVENGSVVVLPIPIKEGHKFLGWFTGDGPNDIQLNDFTPIFRDVNVLASWKKIPYQISFWVDDILISESVLEFGDVINYPSSPQKALNVFMGWSEATSEEIFNSNTMPSRDLMLSPIWEGYYQIDFETKQGEPVDSIFLGHDYQINSLPTPTKVAATFLGWFMDEELLIPFELDKMPRENIILFAKWEEHARITFNTFGGEQLNPIVLETGEQINKLPVPFRLDHTFRGWYLEPTYENKYTSKLMPESNLKLYAKWEALENFKADRLIVNYHRIDERYSPWSVWLWPNQPESKDGRNIAFNDFNVDTGSRQLILELEGSHYESAQRVGIIIRQSDWTKDVPFDLYINLNQADENGTLEVFIFSGDPTVYYGLTETEQYFKTQLIEVSEYMNKWEIIDNPSDKKPDSINLVGVVISIDGNVVYVQDRSATNNKTLAVNLGSDAENVTRGSHVVIRLPQLGESAPINQLGIPSLMYVFKDLQPTLIQIVAKPSVNSIRLDNVEGNPGRFSIPAGAAVKYVQIDEQFMVQIQPESNLGAVLEFPIQKLLPYIDIEGTEADKINTFVDFFPSEFPAFTFTLPKQDNGGDLDIYRIIDIEIALVTLNQKD